MSIRVSLSEQDFRNLVLGNTIEVRGLTDSEEKVYLKIILQDIGIVAMSNALKALHNKMNSDDWEDEGERPPSKANDRNDAIEGG